MTTRHLPPGTRLGPYEIVEVVGRGGMGVVYKAHDPALNRLVALKVLPSEFLSDASFAERFRREAKIWGSLDHPAIVPVFFAGIEGASPFLAMKFVAGGSVSDGLKKGPLAPNRAVAILLEIGAALDYAHARGIVHRDVKPANVLLGEDDRVYLSDFGIARAISGSGAPTMQTWIVGTPGYMAPEQARSQPPHPRADIYSLGCMAYELYTGSPPFRGDTPVEVMMRHLTEQPTPPRALAPALAPNVEGAILKAMAKDPDQRWPTASLFVQALLGAIDADGTVSLPGHPPLARPLPARAAAFAGKIPWIRGGHGVRGLLLAVLIGVTLGAALLTGFEWVLGRVPAGPPPSGREVGSPEALLSAARRALDEGAYPEALQMAELAVKLHPGDARAQLLRERVRRAWDAERSLGLWASPSRPSP